MDVMWAALVACLVVGVAEGQIQPGRASPCVNTFNANAMQCLQNSSLTLPQLNFLITNGRTGNQPTGTLENFRLRVCNMQRSIDLCGRMVVSQLVNATVCANPLDKNRMIATATQIFGGLETACAMPCRRTLLDEFRQCYAFNNIDPKHFMASEVFGRGGFLGNNREDVYHFCSVRMNIMQCFRQKAQLCPESSLVFEQMGLDMQSLEQGVEILCGYPQIYLAGISCFSRPSPEVDMCRANEAQRKNRLQLFALQGLDQNAQAQESCNIKLEAAECEVSAWARTQHESCDLAVLGLRNELECRTMPQQCSALVPTIAQRLCNPQSFYQHERWRYGAASGLAVTWSTLALLLVASLLWNTA